MHLIKIAVNIFGGASDSPYYNYLYPEAYGINNNKAVRQSFEVLFLCVPHSDNHVAKSFVCMSIQSGRTTHTTKLHIPAC
jgi:hypothetical protein